MKKQLMVAMVIVAMAADAATFNVREYGAKGDGRTLDTAAIQKTVDAASGAGGGVVLLEGGTFKSGTIWLKSNVEFRIEMGATLLGSERLEDLMPSKHFRRTAATCAGRAGRASIFSSG